MSELISGKDALIALANGDEVLYINSMYKEKPLHLWGDAKECTVEQFFSGDWLFRLKPQTIKINGIEVEKPKDIAVDPVTGSVRFFYGDLEKTQQASEVLRSIFNG